MGGEGIEPADHRVRVGKGGVWNGYGTQRGLTGGELDEEGSPPCAPVGMQRRQAPQMPSAEVAGSAGVG